MQLPIIDEYNATRDLAKKPFHAVCYAPWTSMVFDPIGRVRACCVNFDYPLGDISKERLDDIWNGERLDRLRNAMLNYDLQFGCQYCERKLTSGAFQKEYVDTATLMTSKFERFDVEFQAPYWPKHLEFHLSNRCNLECVMCTGEFSSTIRRKREQLPPIPAVYTDQFFEDLQKYLPHVQMTQYLGGEPFLIPEMYRIWDMLIDQKLRPHCHITTNGTVWGPKVERIVETLPVAVAVSMDGATKETFEKIRINAKFERVCENLRRFRDCRAKYTYETVINFTMSRMNWHELPDMLLFAEDEGVKLHVLDLLFPERLSLYTLSHDLLSGVIGQFEAAAKTLSGRLKINASILETKVFELRHRLGEIIRTEVTRSMVPDRLQAAQADVSRERESNWTESKKLPTLRVIELDADDSPTSAELYEATPQIAKGSSEFESAANDPQANSTWNIFRGVFPFPTIEDAARKASHWSQYGPIEYIHCNSDDEVVELVSPVNAHLSRVPQVIGSTLNDLAWILAGQLGSDVSMVELNDDPMDYYRTVRFQSPERGATLLRSYFVPRFDENDELFGCTLVIGYCAEATPLTNIESPSLTTAEGQ